MSKGRTFKAIDRGLDFAMALAVAITLGDSAIGALIVCTVGGAIAGVLHYLEIDSEADEAS